MSRPKSKEAVHDDTALRETKSNNQRQGLFNKKALISQGQLVMNTRWLKRKHF